MVASGISGSMEAVWLQRYLATSLSLKGQGVREGGVIKTSKLVFIFEFACTQTHALILKKINACISLERDLCKKKQRRIGDSRYVECRAYVWRVGITLTGYTMSFANAKLKDIPRSGMSQFLDLYQYVRGLK